MATRNIKSTENPNNKGTYLTKENWEVMKPFVHFSVKAIMLIGSAVFAIVKFIPKVLEHKPEEKKRDRVIKI